MDNQAVYSLVQSDIKKVGTNLTLPRYDPMFSDNDSFWSSGVANGIPTSNYSHYDPSIPNTKTNNAKLSVSDLDNNPSNGTYSKTTITQSGKTEEEWKTFYLAIGIVLTLIGVGIPVVSTCAPFLRAENKFERPGIFFIASWYVVWSVIGCVGIYLAANHKSLAIEAYKKQQENNKATVDDRVNDSTTIIRE